MLSMSHSHGVIANRGTNDMWGCGLLQLNESTIKILDIIGKQNEIVCSVIMHLMLESVQIGRARKRFEDCIQCKLNTNIIQYFLM